MAGDGFLGYDAAVEAADPDWSADAAECFEYEWCDGLDNDGDGEVDEDGVLVDTGTYTGTPPSTTQPLTIGINSAFDSTRFEGYLTDVRLWDVARTDQEILDSLWGPVDTTGLVGWWTMDDGAGQTVADASPSGLDGQLGDAAGDDARDPAWSLELPEQ